MTKWGTSNLTIFIHPTSKSCSHQLVDVFPINDNRQKWVEVGVIKVEICLIRANLMYHNCCVF